MATPGTSQYPGLTDTATNLGRIAGWPIFFTLRHTISATDTIIPTTESVDNAPSDGILEISGERIPYTGKGTRTFTGCLRGQFVADGAQPAQAYEAGEDIVLRLTPTHLRVLQDAVMALEAFAAPRRLSLSFYTTGQDAATDREWTNMPSAETELFGFVRNRLAADLTGYTQFRLMANVATTGSAGSKLRLKYSTNAGSSWTDAAASAGTGDVALDGAAFVVGSFVNLATAAKADVWLALFGVGGNGTADPRLGNLLVEVK